MTKRIVVGILVTAALLSAGAVSAALVLSNRAVLARTAGLVALAESDGLTYAAGGGALAQLNPEGGVTKSVPIGITRVAGLAPFRSGKLLVGDAATNTIFSVDASTGASTKFLALSEISRDEDPIGTLSSSGAELASIAFDGASVYAAVRAGYSSAVYQINADTKRVTRHAYTPGPDPDAMQFVDGALFIVTNKGSELRRFTPDLKLNVEIIRLQPGNGLLIKGDTIKRIAQAETLSIQRTAAISANRFTLPVTQNQGRIVLSQAALDLIKNVDLDALVSRKYAVLICGDVAESGYNEFWNDTLWMYKTLINKGYTPERIFVLYGDGNDFISPNPRYQYPQKVTDFAATSTWVNRVFDGLKNGDAAIGVPKMTENDTLFLWAFDHGGGNNPATLGLRDGYMSDTTFAAKVNAIPYETRTIFMQQCRSGGFIDNLTNNKTYIYTACRSFENAHRADTENELFGDIWYCHGEFNYHVICALSGAAPDGTGINADSNSNGKVSMTEAAAWNTNHENQPEVPQVDNTGGVGAGFTLN